VSNYSQITAFTPKDALVTGNPAKVIKGSEMDPEFQAIATAIATKLDTSALPTRIGADAITIATTLPTSSTIGLRGMPVNSQSGNYTCILTDTGKIILHPSDAGSGDTFIIPASTSVDYDEGTIIAFANLASADLTVQITTDTMYLEGTTTEGPFILGQNCTLYAKKMTSTVWLCTGVGITT
jgi:hypothetical protein